jgi:transposase-like protein
MAKASKHIQPYPPEFRAEAIRLARTSGKSHREIAEDLGIIGWHGSCAGLVWWGATGGD